MLRVLFIGFVLIWTNTANESLMNITLTSLRNWEEREHGALSGGGIKRWEMNKVRSLVST
jgi:hypothetical protein